MIDNSTMKLIQTIKDVRWQFNKPANGQAQDWTSFDIVVAEDSQGNLYWGFSIYKPQYVMEKVRFFPLPKLPENDTPITRENLNMLAYCERFAPPNFRFNVANQPIVSR